MKSISRYEEYKDTELDTIILKIRNGTIKSGRYSHLVKIDKNKVYSENQKEFFKDKGGDSN